MKKRLILSMLLCFVAILVFSVTSFAFEIPSEYEGTNFGQSYNTSHDDGCCTITDGDSTVNHYYEGYKAGYGDGLLSDGVTEDQKQAIIEEYLNSNEFNQKIEEAKQQGAEESKSQTIEDFKQSAEFTALILEAQANAVKEYKSSSEYNSALQSNYSSGVDAGYQSGYNAGYEEGTEVMYSTGYAEGSANFRTSAEYKATLQANYDGAYLEGYNDAQADMNSASGEEKGSNVFSILGVVSSIITLLGVVLFFFKFKNKKKGK